MSKFNSALGRNINKARNARGLTLQQLSMKLVDYGFDISVQALSLIENGKRNITAEQVFYICKALDCSIANVYPAEDSGKIKNIAEAVKSEPLKIQEILEYTFFEWQGNTTALWHFVGLYVALPQEMRYFIALSGINLYQIARDTNKLNSSAPKANDVYVEKEADKLRHHGKLKFEDE